MLENLYTTKMSANKKTLQNRFTKIRRGSGRISKIMAAVMSCTVAAAMLGATIVMAAVGNEEKNFFIDGKGYAIEPVLIENSLATHTDNYFVPLRKTFEALGYKVSYDVDKSKYQRLMDKHYSFPSYDSVIHYEQTDDEGNTYLVNWNSYEWHKPLVTSDIDYYIYGATGRMNGQLPIIEMTKDGKTEYCQIGSREYSTGYAVAPVMINGSAYIPLRIVATIVGGDDNIKWDDAKHDTYFEGILTFDESAKTITVNTHGSDAVSAAALSNQSELCKKTSEFLQSEFYRVYKPYYDIRSLTVSSWQERGNEAQFFYKMTYLNYNRDPDKAEYIQEAKQRSKREYEILYNDYLALKESNYEFKVILNGDTPELYYNSAPKGEKWERVTVDDFVLSN